MKKFVFICLILVLTVDVYLNNLNAQNLKVDSKNEKNLKYTLERLNDAILENNISLVKEILESKTLDINKKDLNGKYPLEMVLVMNNCDMAKILLRAGADPYVRTEDGITIYEKVMLEGSKYLKEIFKEHKKMKSCP